ncbi:2f385ef7-1269-4849-bba6-0fb73c5d5a35 [Thermothielavioides terrestris]|nr:2f385ef7-1269-4849-bba6-0fb73c5d5a35 [Thermothielavioides terrestris]
MLEKTS